MLVQLLRKYLREACFVICGPYPGHRGIHSVYYDQATTALRSVWSESLFAPDLFTKFVDFWGSLSSCKDGLGGWRRGEHLPDGVHPNCLGHEKLFKTVCLALSEAHWKMPRFPRSLAGKMSQWGVAAPPCEGPNCPGGMHLAP